MIFVTFWGGGGGSPKSILGKYQKTYQHIGIADWKVFARICKVGSKSSQNIVKVWKIHGQSGRFLDSLEGLKPIWKVYNQSGRFPTKLESFGTALKVSGPSRRFTINLETPEACHIMDKITEGSHQQSLQTKWFICCKSNFWHLSQKHFRGKLGKPSKMHYNAQQCAAM